MLVTILLCPICLCCFCSFESVVEIVVLLLSLLLCGCHDNERTNVLIVRMYEHRCADMITAVVLQVWCMDISIDHLLLMLMRGCASYNFAVSYLSLLFLFLWICCCNYCHLFVISPLWVSWQKNLIMNGAAGYLIFAATLYHALIHNICIQYLCIIKTTLVLCWSYAGTMSVAHLLLSILI